MCSLDGSKLSCLYEVILGDNDPVPLQPNLDSENDINDIKKFLVWSSNTDSPFISFGFSGAQQLTAINIEFLSYPAQGITLPDLQLYSTPNPITINPSSPNVESIEFDIRNNSVLSQDDYQVTNASLVFSTPRTSSAFLLCWDSSRVYNFNHFMVSEVDFCADTHKRTKTHSTEC